MEKVLKIIQANSKKTGNGSGITTVKLLEESKMEYRELFKVLQDLISAGKVKVREGINHKLLFAL